MSDDFYTAIGKTVVLFMKYIFIPILVSVVASVLVNRYLHPQPDRQKKKRSYKNRSYKINHQFKT